MIISRTLVIVAALTGVVIGAAGGWWYNLPPTPWLKFGPLSASYAPEAQEITLKGSYTVHRMCNKGLDVIWRTEAIATDGQLAVYGPKPGMPLLTAGDHPYSSTIPLLERIRPDGWVVRVIATCPGEDPETVVSMAATVGEWSQDGATNFWEPM